MGKGKRKRRRKQIHFATEKEWIDAFIATPDDELPNVHAVIVRDSLAAGMSIPDAYERADAIQTYLALAVSNAAAYSSTLNTWENQGEKTRGVSGGHWIPMTWDFAESNPDDRMGRNIENICRVLMRLPGNE